MPLVSRGKCAASVKRQVCHPRGKCANQEASVTPKRQVCHPRGKCATQEASAPPKRQVCHPRGKCATQEPNLTQPNKEKKKKTVKEKKKKQRLSESCDRDEGIIFVKDGTSRVEAESS